MSILALIDNAAALEGVSRADFMMESARDRALKILGDQRLHSLEPQDSAAFAEALEKPPAASDALRGLMRSKVPWEHSDEA
jgi:uncharacterized protein (DUF1778 family)